MSSIEIRDDGAVRVVTLNRPDVRNALSAALRSELLSALHEADAEASVRVIVVTGTGAAFCAGLDLRELEATVTGSEADHRADSAALAELFLAVVESPKPVVAAVNGAAVAGGAGLVTACDVAFAARSARFGYTEARIGFVAALVSVLLVRQVGDKHARELLLGAGLVSAERALAMGLVNEVVDDGAALERAMEFARTVSRNAPGSLAATKGLLRDVGSLGLRQGFEAALEVNVASRSGAELAEGVRAFLEKREPAWRA
ncbi:MAG TPA: enoyl-CoA hydratase-related protein [Trueperaceae bacterium]|nr:enoyl-CoA hydratase-related protein [Trueperaceae bacterium]